MFCSAPLRHSTNLPDANEPLEGWPGGLGVSGFFVFVVMLHSLLVTVAAFFFCCCCTLHFWLCAKGVLAAETVLTTKGLHILGIGGEATVKVCKRLGLLHGLLSQVRCFKRRVSSGTFYQPMSHLHFLMSVSQGRVTYK